MESNIIINVSRNLSKVDEMRMDSGKYSLRAEIESAGGAVKKISNGTIADAESLMQLGVFNAYGPGAISVSLQGAGTREERSAIYDAVEDFVEGVTAKVAADAKTVDEES